MGAQPMEASPQGGPPMGAPPRQLSDSAASSYVNAKIKQLPAEQQNSYYNYRRQVSELPRVLEQIEQYPDDFGMFSDVSQYIPGQEGSWTGSLQKLVRGGQDALRSEEALQARTAVYQIAYEKIHALAGAALSTGERQRLEAFLPSPTDPINKIKANLKQAYMVAGYGINDFEHQMGIPQEYWTTVPALDAKKQGQQSQRGGDEIIEVDY